MLKNCLWHIFQRKIHFNFHISFSSFSISHEMRKPIKNSFKMQWIFNKWCLAFIGNSIDKLVQYWCWFPLWLAAMELRLKNYLRNFNLDYLYMLFQHVDTLMFAFALTSAGTNSKWGRLSSIPLYSVTLRMFFLIGCHSTKNPKQVTRDNYAINL